MSAVRALIRLMLVFAALGLCAGAVVAPSAGAAGLLPAVADCNLNVKLTRHYRVSLLRAALNSIPADVGEYSDCHDIINHQLLLQLGRLPGGGGAGGGGGSFLPVWLIVVLALLVAAGAGFGVLASRNRREGGGEPPDGPSLD